MSTVVAISTPAGQGAIGIVRLSGEDAIKIADRVFFPSAGKSLDTFKGYTAGYGEIKDDNEVIDDGVATVFRHPKSYTGEDMVEITCHGNPIIATKVMKALVKAGAEPAGAGEFTKRAFLNGKMDLIEAESVAELIAAKGEAELRLIRRKREGVLSRRIDTLSNELTHLAAQLAVWLDYPDDVVMELTHEDILPIVVKAVQELTVLLEGYDTAKKITQGVAIAIVGRPNAGKSTLMNLLSKEDKSIVTHYAGTTRDVVENRIELSNMAIRLLDTAGLRETTDPVEAIGVERAYRELEKADLVALVLDGSLPLTQEDHDLLQLVSVRRGVIILNKEDLGLFPGVAEMVTELAPKLAVTTLNGKTGEGLGHLTETLTQLCGADQGDDLLISNQRERLLITKALAQAKILAELVENGMPFDILTVGVDELLAPLWEMVGRSAGQEVIAEIFEKFCVGK